MINKREPKHQQTNKQTNKQKLNLIDVLSHVLERIQTFSYEIQPLILLPQLLDSCYHYTSSDNMQQTRHKLACFILLNSYSCLNWPDSSVRWKYSLLTLPSDTLEQIFLSHRVTYKLQTTEKTIYCLGSFACGCDQMLVRFRWYMSHKILIF